MSYWVKAFLTVALAVLLVPSPAQAKIIVQPDFQGTLLITFPDGKVQMYDAGEALPDIPSGASIEIFGGKLSVSTDEKDSVKLTCLGSEASVGGGAACTMGCGESDGKLQVVKGPVRIVQGDGSQKDIPEGEEYPIRAKDDNPQNPPPTSDDNLLGTPAAEVPPPDSQSIEASAPGPENGIPPPDDSRGNETSPSE